MSPSIGSSAELRQAFNSQIGLCDELEQLADALPKCDRQQCLRVARLIRPLVTQSHKVEKAIVFPQLVARLAEGSALVEAIRIDHLEDEYFADEVADHLLLMGLGHAGLEPEAVGYMLRAFFDSVRRRIRHEQALLGPLPH